MKKKAPKPATDQYPNRFRNPFPRESRTFRYEFNKQATMKTMKVVKRVGYIDKNRKYDSPCAQSYIEYEQCLQQTEFNRVKCLPKQQQVIACEKEKDMYQLEMMKKKLKTAKSDLSANKPGHLIANQPK